MNRKEWIDREVERACRRENPKWDGKSFDYGCSCYANAGDAAKAATAELEKAGHSGMSHAITLRILKRLLDGKPITPITDDDFEGGMESFIKEAGIKTIQCPRYSSLFKETHADGSVSYSDVERAVCFSTADPNDRWQGAGSDIVDKMFPIAMPYSPPDRKYEVAIEHALHDRALGDYDMYRIAYIIKPDGERVAVDRCYREVIAGWRRFGKDAKPSARSGGFKEIPLEEYERLRKAPQIESEWKEGDPIETIEFEDACCGG